ncbi:MAG: SulP family inorganic anion transporter [Flavobacteriaceae bacterium]|nr:SulP family inorganic anion transporter [Flavobacteriaceae bacterium]
MARVSPFQNFFFQLPRNVFSGFVVSLVALPLGLGLALASNAPPLSGIIAAVVGGVTVAILGGSQVTITGPGNGLVVVLLSSISLLGEGDLYQGYLFTLAAIVISGVLLFCFGAFKLGSIGEFFPSSALQGMLAAIGIGILSKQFHVMLGFTDISGKPIDLILLIPNSFYRIFENPTSSVLIASILGLTSLIVLFLYSKLRAPVFRLIPAPMWVVLIAIGLSYYFEYFSSAITPFNSDLLISIPSDILNSFPFPDFDKFFKLSFWGVVISLTLIATIESLLSIKAVDKLDPQKRRSNINKDLRALGLATVISGLIGGLNVVTVIARSSVNVNTGATNRSSNFFHASFLFLFIILFQDQIQRIALPALAAILVYTGYKLAAPRNIIRIMQIGKEQLAIFLLTLFSTLFSGIIVGISVGILSTFIIHIMINNSFFLFSRNLLKPNVLMFREEESKNYYVSVKNFCSFLNFYKLKTKLEEIPESDHVILDFSLCEFVDHTVMEGINDYRRVFSRKGGVFEIIGLDVHLADTQHPFAIRKVLPIKEFFTLSQNLTKRQLSLEKLSKVLNLNYSPEMTSESKNLDLFIYFKTKIINYQNNQLNSEENNFSFFDLSYSEGAFIAKEDLRATFLLVNVKQKIPSFILDKERFLDSLSNRLGYFDINFKKYPKFSKQFFLSGSDRLAVRSLFKESLIKFLEQNPLYYIESRKNQLLIKGKDRLMSIEEIKNLLNFATGVVSIIKTER